MALETIEGQPRAVELLRRALASDRVAHAYAFIGPAGSGRTTTALAFAQALVGMAKAGPHPDVHLIVPTPPESNPKGPKAIRIGAIRELERRASLKPALAPYKVFILDDADRMTGEAPQAFLKTLEEPPARTSWDDLWKGLETCREAREALAVNVTPRLTLEVLLSRLALARGLKGTK